MMMVMMMMMMMMVMKTIDVVAAEPMCSTNVTDSGYCVSESDSIAIRCDFEFSGNLSPDVTCLTNTSGQVDVTDTRQVLSRFITYQKVVAVSAELRDKQLSCSISFTDLANTSLEQHNRPTGVFQQASYRFNWTSPRVYVIHNGKYNRKFS